MGKTDVNVMSGAKVPALRFKGFNDEWAEKKLGDIAEFNPSSKLPDTFEYVDLESVQGTSLVSHRSEYVSSAPSRAKRLAEKGDVFFQTVRPYQMNNLLFDFDSEEDYVFSTGYAQMRPLLTDSQFLFNRLFEERFVNEVLTRSTGSNYPAINSTDLSKIEASFPKLPEQQQIGEVFKTVNTLIQSEQDKLEQLNALKKSFLQKMFPKKGATVPELRFDGFSCDWVEKKLGDVFSRVSDKGRTDLQFVTVTERETNFRDDSDQGYGNDKSNKAKARAKIVLEGQFLIDLTSYSRGIYMCRMDGLTSNAYNVLNMNEGDEGFWIEYFLTHDFVELLKSITPPGARQGKMIEVDSLLKRKMMVPSLEEQQAIGQFFNTFDELIEKQKEKVENTEIIKKALLQKMFV